MISVSGRNWEQNKTIKNAVEKLKQDYNFRMRNNRLTYEN